MSAVQDYDTDALQEHVDSTAVLISRLEQWHQGVKAARAYVDGYHRLHTDIGSNLERTAKATNEGPQFPDSGAARGSAASDAPTLANVFLSLRTQTTSLAQKNQTVLQGIKGTVVPQLDSLEEEIEKHYKTLRTQGSKGMKEIKNARDSSQKLIETLGRVTSSFGTRGIDHKDDPYVLKRRVEANIWDQVGKENTQAEAALSVQRSFASLETHILQILQQCLSNLDQLISGFAIYESDSAKQVTKNFQSINVEKELNYFKAVNKENLVPDTGYQRTVSHVHFPNENHSSTKPIIEGVLSRKTTVLKNYQQHYFVVTPAGYMHQFKSKDATADAQPELSWYLPDCQLSGNSDNYTFRVVGKEAGKVLGGRHKYVFKTTSIVELEAWYNAIARVTGNRPTDQADDEGEDSAPATPVEPPTKTMENVKLSEPRNAPASTPSAAHEPEVPPSAEPRTLPAQPSAHQEPVSDAPPRIPSYHPSENDPFSGF